MNVILHEGKDDKKYIKKFLNILNIESSDDNFFEMKGKPNFYKTNSIAYRRIKQKVNNKQIEKILFILDADYEKDNSKYGGYNNTKEQLDIIIDGLGLKDISKIFIACNPQTKDGFFEVLLFSAVSEELKGCYQDFINCSKFNKKENYKTVMSDLHKYSSPGKPYDFNHKNFKELKDKLLWLFSN